MSSLFVPELLPFVDEDYCGIQKRLALLDWHPIAHAPWREQYPYEPLAKFQIAHTGTNIVLHYEVQEAFVKAQYVRSNENVWEDSCVEFFISLDGKQQYFNFEFNVLGTGLIGFGSAIKTDRKRLEAVAIETISSYTLVQNSNGKKKWNLILVIPVEILGTSSIRGQVAHGNFYKCGDGLPEPHFMSYNDIKNPTPNFHLPQFFGEICFE